MTTHQLPNKMRFNCVGLGIFSLTRYALQGHRLNKIHTKKEERPIELTRTAQREAIKNETTKYEIAIK